MAEKPVSPESQQPFDDIEPSFPLLRRDFDAAFAGSQSPFYALRVLLGTWQAHNEQKMLYTHPSFKWDEEVKTFLNLPIHSEKYWLLAFKFMKESGKFKAEDVPVMRHDLQALIANLKINGKLASREEKDAIIKVARRALNQTYLQ